MINAENYASQCEGRVHETTFNLCKATRKNSRKQNEDSFASLISGDYLGLIVADGLGGHANGRAASFEAVEMLVSHLNLSTVDSFEQDVLNALPFVQNALDQHSDNRDTTLVIAVVFRNQIKVANIGDSFASYKSDKVYRTVDQESEYGWLVHTARCFNPNKVDFYTWDIPIGESTFIIASDGLEDLTDEELHSCIKHKEGNRADILCKLVPSRSDHADNATALTVLLSREPD